MQSTTLFPILMLTIFNLTAFGAHAENTAESLRPIVVEIAGENSEARQTYIGMVAARTEVDLGFPVSGSVANRSVDLGDTVKRGDVLARLDPETLEAEVWAARAGVVVSQQKLNSASAALEREQTLASKGVVSQALLENADRAFSAAKARLEQARATLVRAEDVLASANLLAPIDGVIIEVLVEAGSSVSAGQPVVKLAGAGAREVVIDLGENDFGHLQRNTNFKASLLAVPQTTSVVSLRSIDPVADRQTRTRRLHFALQNPQAEFRIGALVRLTPPNQNQRKLTVPVQAVLIDESGVPFVWVVTRKAVESGIVERATITLGTVLEDRVLVKTGLSLGQEIIIKGVNSIQDGQHVGPRVIK